MHFDHNETLEEARERNIRDALFEDIGLKDWTAELVPNDAIATAELIVREEAILCGTAWFEGCFKKIDTHSKINWFYDEGQLMTANSLVCRIQGLPRALLTAERPAMNFLQTLSATATITYQHVQAIDGASPNPKGCAILDTRKTLPGLRQAQKYAVVVGGGQNQRLALWDGILIKENHIAAAGSIQAALEAALASNPNISIQIEVESLNELKQALDAGAKNILLDNFNTEQMRQAVAINQGQALLEASGGINLYQLREIASTGVDRISIGKLTKDVSAIDFSLRILEH